jgi:cytochrome c oxidase subunit 1
MSADTTQTFVDRFPEEAAITRKAFLVAFVMLGIGAFMGIVQALHRTNVIRIIDSADYYTVLTAHGVFLAIVFTIFFLVGLYQWAITRSLDRGPVNITVTKAWLALMSIGSVMTGATILLGFIDEVPISADVLFTFYAPLQAHPAFYAGLVIFIIGTWLAGADWFRTWLAWKKDNPDERIPLQTFMVLTTMIMWYVATIGATRSFTSGSCQRTCSGTPCYRRSPADSCSATRWPASSSSSLSSSRRPSGFTTSTSTPASRRASSSSRW